MRPDETIAIEHCGRNPGLRLRGDFGEESPSRARRTVSHRRLLDMVLAGHTRADRASKMRHRADDGILAPVQASSSPASLPPNTVHRFI